MKTCNNCGEEKPYEAFSKRKASKDGLQSRCKECSNRLHSEWKTANRDKMLGYFKNRYEENREELKEAAKAYRRANPENTKASALSYKKENKAKCAAIESKRRSCFLKATPEWYNREEVEYIYSLAAEKGWVVDHIVPLNSKLVCGLNVQDNLRVIPQALNSHKGNRYWPDMPDSA